MEQEVVTGVVYGNSLAALLASSMPSLRMTVFFFFAELSRAFEFARSQSST